MALAAHHQGRDGCFSLGLWEIRRILGIFSCFEFSPVFHQKRDFGDILKQEKNMQQRKNSNWLCIDFDRRI